MFFKYGSILICAFFVLLLGLLKLPWTPQYQIYATVNYQPKLILVRAPVTGVIKFPSIAYTKIQEGSTLFGIYPITSLYNKDYQINRATYLKNKLQHLTAELNYQKRHLQSLMELFKKKLIAEAEYHQKNIQYQQLVSKRAEFSQNIKELEHKIYHVIQAPAAGVAMFNCQSGDLVSKGKVLVIIKPKKIKYQLALTLPSAFRDKVFVGQQLRLAWLTFSSVKNYPITARITNVMPYVKDEKILMQAEITNAAVFEQKLLNNQPLEGYLMGKTMPLWRWLLDLVRDY